MTKQGPNYIAVALLVILVSCALLRTGGLFRGLEEGVVYHPDSPKQVLAAYQFLHGRTVWYMNSHFYDGFPLFLNHVDAWIIKLIRPAAQWFTAHVNPFINTSPEIEKEPLYYWLRSLRVFYSLIIVAMTFLLGRMLTRSAWAGVLCALLTAASPLQLAVSHAATGDIGVELFLLPMALFLGAAFLRESKWRPVYCFLAGMMLAFAFAAKYHGLLGTGLAGLFFLVLLASRSITSKQVFRYGLSMLAGFIIGTLTAIPQFFINADRTWDDMVENFVFIRNYNVDDAFLQLSWHEQLAFAMQNNLGKIVDALGWGLVSVTLLGIAMIFLVRKKIISPIRENRLPLTLAVLFFAPIAGFIALTGKPAVQPFHFSFLVPFFAVGAVASLSITWKAIPRLRWLIICLFAFILAEQVVNTHAEYFFWSRMDIGSSKKQQERFFVSDQYTGDLRHGAVRNLKLEHAKLPVFRNGPKDVIIPGGTLLSDIQAVPLPTIPFDTSTTPDWIFMNGPTLLRNDRMFLMKPGKRHTTYAVYTNLPKNIQVGYVNRLEPCRLLLERGNTKTNLMLRPGESGTITLPVSDHVHGEMMEGGEIIYLVPLTAKAQSGGVILSLFQSEREAAWFLFYNGHAVTPPAESPFEDNNVKNALRALRFYESAAPATIARKEDVFLLHNQYLPSGSYLLDVYVPSLKNEQRLSVQLEDYARIPFLKTNVVLSANVPHHLQLRIEKPYMPPFCSLVLSSENNRPVPLTSWRLKPDVSAPLPENTSAEFQPHIAQTGSTSCKKPIKATFARAIEFSSIRIPDAVTTRAGFPVFFDAVWKKIPFEHFSEYFIFFHFLDEQGNQKAATDIPLYRSLLRTASTDPAMLDLPETIEPGTYSVWMGIYNSRTQKRMSVSGTSCDVDHRRIKLGSLHIDP